MARRNKGERAPSGGGEREKSAERKKVEQEIGKETVNAVDKYYERQGKKAERASDEELAQLEKMLRETTDGRNHQKYYMNDGKMMKKILISTLTKKSSESWHVKRLKRSARRK